MERVAKLLAVYREPPTITAMRPIQRNGRQPLCGVPRAPCATTMSKGKVPLRRSIAFRLLPQFPRVYSSRAARDTKVEANHHLSRKTRKTFACTNEITMMQPVPQP